MSDPSNNKGFLSYAHEDVKIAAAIHSALEEHLKNDDGNRKRKIFFDKVSLSPGSGFESVINAAAQSAMVGIVLVSKHFVHSRYALPKELPLLNDLRKAGKLHILPVQISDLNNEDIACIERRFPSFGRLHRLRTRSRSQSLAPEDEETLKGLADLIRWMMEILSHSQLHSVTALPYHFVRREELRNKIVKWTGLEEARLCVIAGEAGIGKSSLMDWLAKLDPNGNCAELPGQLLARHRCTTETQGTGDPAESFVKNVASQLLLRPEYFDRFTVDQIEEIAKVGEKEAHSVFVGLLMPWIKDTLDSSVRSGCSFLLVDALDQIERRGGSLIDILASAAKWNEFPRNLRIVVTTRPNREVEKKLRKGLNIRYIPISKDDCKADVREYLDKHLRDDGGMPQWARTEKDARTDTNADVEAERERRNWEETGRKTALENVERECNGLFLIAEHVLHELKLGYRKLGDVGKFRLQSLDEYYEKYFARNASAANKLPTERLLALLLAAGDQVPHELLEQCFCVGDDPAKSDDFSGAIEAIRPLLDPMAYDNGQVCFHHQQVSRWIRRKSDTVTDIGPRAFCRETTQDGPKLEIDVAKAHRLLAVVCCEDNVAAMVAREPIRCVDVNAMECRRNQGCKARLPKPSHLIGSEAIVTYAARHGPRHMIRSFPPDQPQRLVPCAINFLSRLEEKGDTYRQNTRRLTRHFGDVFSEGVAPHKEWIGRISGEEVDELTKHIKDIYETEILVGPMRLMLERSLGSSKPAFRPELDEILQGDYVMRFGMAMSFALAYKEGGRRIAALERWMRNMWNNEDALHERELGAYAICLTAGIAPEFASAEGVNKLLGNISIASIYPPRSAYGDLLLNDACRRVHFQFNKEKRPNAEVPAGQWNWERWEHTRLDAIDLMAMNRCWGLGLELASSVPDDLAGKVTEAERAFEEAEEKRAELSGRKDVPKRYQTLLKKYWYLGAEFELIRIIKETPLKGAL